MMYKFIIFVLGFILMFLTFNNPLSAMCSDSGVFEVYTFWIVVLYII
ncbi:hypothetical protein SAMN05216243_2977 [Sediminibacillus albus]|uniref:Uncharacterized protein n=1 Tax=Sediminibacillus albus TaxID=407036 RepID=A0A1G9BE89_9BACI|nr:hypothetical protein SAMN05216243_2977 [Sediminibacillus albus]